MTFTVALLPADLREVIDRPDLIPEDVKEAFTDAMILMEDSGLLTNTDQVRAQMVAALRLTFGYLALAKRQAAP